MDILLESRRTLRGDLQAQRNEARVAAEEIERLEAQVADAAIVKEERDRLRSEVKKISAERDRLSDEKKRSEEEVPKLLEEAGNAGFNEAGEHYKLQVENLVKAAFKEGEAKGIQETHPSSFLRGYQVGLDYAEIPEADHRQEPPVVPPVELPERSQPIDKPDPAHDTEQDANANVAEA